MRNPQFAVVARSSDLLLCLQVDTKGLAIIDASVAPAAQELWLSGASHTQPENSMHQPSL